MRSKRWILSLTGVLALSPLLAACGDDGDDGEATDPTSEVEESDDLDDDDDDVTPTESVDPVQSESASPTDSGTTAGALPAACDVLTPRDIATAYGATPGPGEVGGGGYSENDVEWQTDNCDFSAEDFFEVELAIAGPDDFPAGFSCPPQTDIGSTVTKVKVRGATKASWEQEAEQPLEASLRACTDDVLIEIGLEFEDSYQHEGDPRMQTIGLAEKVLKKLG